MSRPIILREEMNPRYCSSRACRSPIGLPDPAVPNDRHLMPQMDRSGCLCLREGE